MTSRMDKMTTIQESREKAGSRKMKSSDMDENSLNLPLEAPGDDTPDVGVTKNNPPITVRYAL